MINQNKIDEWIREVETRPSSAVLIIQYIANRLSELAIREEELAAQNIELLSGRKVEEYEIRIANLEYQLELLKRQLGGEIILPTESPATRSLQEMLELLVFNPLGQVLRAECAPKSIISAQTQAHLAKEASLEDVQPSVLVTTSQEELLFLFDSGRTVTLPVSHLPPGNPDDLSWQQAFMQEPRVREQLAAIIPIARLSLYDVCIQASRRGFVKKVKTSSLASHITEKYVGTGVKLPADKTFGLTFANNADLFVMVSQEGYIFSMPVDHLPVAIEEVIHLGITDHIVTAFVTDQKSSILFMTQNGKAVNRDVTWLDPASSFKTKGQALLSRERIASGTRLVGAAAVDDDDWVLLLHDDGSLITYKIRELLAAGSAILPPNNAGIRSFASFHVPETKA